MRNKRRNKAAKFFFGLLYKGKEKPRARALIDFVKNNTEQLNSFQKPLNIDEADKLLNEYPEEDIKVIFLSMDNKKDIHKKNVSVYKTAIFWLGYKNEKKLSTKTEKNGKFNDLKAAAKNVLAANSSK